MPTWNSDLYLKFATERSQPAVDLAARVAVDNPGNIIDVGCGPGTSTSVLARRWPHAHLTGLDSSPDMIAAAQKEIPNAEWLVGDIAAWEADRTVDIVFSNAALQWVPDHPVVFPRLFAQVVPGGALAVQMPADIDAAPHRVMRELAASDAWRDHFTALPREWHAEPPEAYYDILAPYATRIDLWTTEYVHVFPGVEKIVDWYRGTGLRPWLDALPDDATRARFEVAYGEAIAPLYPARVDGRVLFPFRRLFIIAYR
jgi:trans-aconitate 2-methyltransferase